MLILYLNLKKYCQVVILFLMTTFCVNLMASDISPEVYKENERDWTIRIFTELMTSATECMEDSKKNVTFCPKGQWALLNTCLIFYDKVVQARQDYYQQALQHVWKQLYKGKEYPLKSNLTKHQENYKADKADVEQGWTTLSCKNSIVYRGMPNGDTNLKEQLKKYNIKLEWEDPHPAMPTVQVTSKLKMCQEWGHDGEVISMGDATLPFDSLEEEGIKKAKKEPDFFYFEYEMNQQRKPGEIPKTDVRYAEKDDQHLFFLPLEDKKHCLCLILPFERTVNPYDVMCDENFCKQIKKTYTENSNPLYNIFTELTNFIGDPKTQAEDSKYKALFSLILEETKKHLTKKRYNEEEMSKRFRKIKEKVKDYKLYPKRADPVNVALYIPKFTIQHLSSILPSLSEIRVEAAQETFMNVDEDGVSIKSVAIAQNIPDGGDGTPDFCLPINRPFGHVIFDDNGNFITGGVVTFPEYKGKEKS